MSTSATHRKRTLYVTDLDGTLLNGESRVSDRSADILNALISRGVMFTVATARTPATVQPLLSRVHQSVFTDAEGAEHPLPAIVMTGAALWNRQTQIFEQCTLIPEADALRIRDIFAAHEVHPFVYCLSGNDFINVYHPAAMTRREDAFYQERRHLQLKRFHLDQQPSDMAHVVLFFAIGPEEIIEATDRELKSATRCAVAWYRDAVRPATGLIDLYAPGVSKASALRKMKERTGARRVVVFGDNLNDLPMLREADVAVAVGNALPEVKAQADVVIGRNTEIAVPKFILND